MSELMKHILFAILFFVSLGTVSAESRMDEQMLGAGCRDVAAELPGVRVRLMYASADNFTGCVLYDSLTRAYLTPDAIRALAKARRLLKQTRPDLDFLILDAARPVSVQRSMFSKVRGTSQARYVANPASRGGTHNYGIAVDITLCDSLGRELPMGTPVDYFGPEAHITDEAALLRTGLISSAELANRRLLRRVLTAAGFRTIRREWWHFELCRREQAPSRYRLLDF